MKKATKKTGEKLIEKIEIILSESEDFKSEIESEFDELSEKQQEGTKGEQLQEEIDGMDNVISEIETALDSLHTVIST